ncbi:protein-L-isoaspartate(D-aspartate) O-methyltransferase [bacterium]|nr:protein-L-isoaspartate(D-aspartate) O-methyltransferase [bacterium]
MPSDPHRNHRRRLIVLVVILVALLAVSAFAGGYDDARERMVKTTIADRGVTDERVLAAMRKVPRHEFVPPALRPIAYTDTALPIARGQTISQPYIVAFMTEAARIGPKDKVLEIGTGSGYQAAVLAEVAREVYSIEILCDLAESAQKTLKRIGYGRVKVKCGDGFRGWPENAPFDAILVTAAPKEVPRPLIEQLAEGGRLVIPVGESFQNLARYVKRKGDFVREDLLPVRFVPMTGPGTGVPTPTAP